MLERCFNWLMKEQWAAVIAVLSLVVSGYFLFPFTSDSQALIEPLRIDALPDLSENLQIVQVNWSGQSPEEVQKRVTVPLSRVLSSLKGLKTQRSHSSLGKASIYLIFEDQISSDESRLLIQERLATLPNDLLPHGLSPKLGPEANALGQIYWYSLEARDAQNNKMDSWNLQELRTINDFYIKDQLLSVHGIAEVATIGGFEKTYQIVLNPGRMAQNNIDLSELIQAIRKNNTGSFGQTIDMNRLEYIIEAKGYLESLEELENCLVKKTDDEIIYLKDIASIKIGNERRRGILEKDGTEAVGGIITARYDANVYEVLKNIKSKIAIINSSLPQKMVEGQLVTLQIQPFYDRSILIEKSIHALNKTLCLQMLITGLVILLFMRSLKAGLLIILVLPFSVAATFLLMKLFDIQANMATLAGIGIAIGTIVDLGIIQIEHLFKKPFKQTAPEIKKQIREGIKEVGPLLFLAGMTTIISFLPLLTLEGPPGKLFNPLAITKTLALAASMIIVLFLIPVAAYWMLRYAPSFKRSYQIKPWLLLIALLGLAVLWQPLGPSVSIAIQLLFLFSLLFLGGLFFYGILKFHKRVLLFILKIRTLFCLLLVIGMYSAFQIWHTMDRGFLPVLNEEQFLLMPSTLPHFSLEENKSMLFLLDKAISAIPEVDYVVGKVGQSNSILDPAPISMFEILIAYKEAYGKDENGQLIRQWRAHIEDVDDIWDEITGIVQQIPGLTLPPKLQPIETRLLMLQTGIRSSMGIAVRGKDKKTIDRLSSLISSQLKRVTSIDPQTVVEETIGERPYISIKVDAQKAALFGWQTGTVYQHIQAGIGGIKLGHLVEDNEEYTIKLEYEEMGIEALKRLLVDTKNGTVALGDLCSISYEKGPEYIRSEEGLLVHHIFFSPKPGVSNSIAIDDAKKYLEKNIPSGLMDFVSYAFVGDYQQQQTAFQQLVLIITGAILCILFILYMQFKQVIMVLLICSGILVAFCGGFWSLWLFDQLGAGSFFDAAIELNVGVWVGFLILLGIATDDGVLVADYLRQLNPGYQKTSKSISQTMVVHALSKRIRPALMTTATTALAMLPILTSTGSENTFLLAMALPLFGGVLFQIINVFTIPVLYTIWMDLKR